ncbi:glycoside hydrolase family 3 protein [Stemphylium lycopersici]|uniref:beta-glucosidase n=1 Tax=Stemphylium lycopersici TaxID=183478 RepID=A0A364NE24_STELY|nr:glycoside hydrolase family 3 protein [Stemphylium lycopersici]
MLYFVVWLGHIAAVAAQFDFTHTQYETSPPVYPSRWGQALDMARDFVGQLTLEEKAGMVTGTAGPCVGNIAPVSRLNFSGLCLQDGPLAIRQAVFASVFPAQLSVAASWDRSLARQRALFMGKEFRAKGAHVLLGPVAGPLGRSPFGGRNWEGFSPDAYLSGELVAVTVEGIQSAGVQAATKHFIANEQEIQRNPTLSVNGTTIEAISSNVDDKTMHETYLWPFANAVRAGTAAVMCSYQRINGSYGCQNSKAQNGLLKEELAFQGLVMSDWYATHAGVPSANAGLDMNMPGSIDFFGGSASYFGGNITMAVNNGSLSVDRLDDMVVRVMTPYFHLQQHRDFPPVDGFVPPSSFGPLPPFLHNFTLGPIVDVRRQEHADLIRTLGAAGTVLLKNTGALPLSQPRNVGVFGNGAADFTQGQYSLVIGSDGSFQGNYDIGMLPVGGGSGTGRFASVVSPLEAIKSRAGSYGAEVQYITDNDAIVSGGLFSLAPVPMDVCLVFLKTWASEGDDRTTLLAGWNSTLVVESVAAVCPNTVVVLHGAAPNVLPWADHPNVTAILAAHFPGQEIGNAIVDILWGDVNPSGKLPYTIAMTEDDYAKNLVNDSALHHTTNPYAWSADFIEGSLIDFKEFDAKNASVRYAFGFGLSYTTFELSALDVRVPNTTIPRTPIVEAQTPPGGHEALWETIATVSVTVKNTGDVGGSAVTQLYLAFPEEAVAPVKVLRGFENDLLSPGESKEVKFDLKRRDLSYWNTTAQTWTLPEGSYNAMPGFSSRDLLLKRGFELSLSP